jgi:hypothetical protein
MKSSPLVSCVCLGLLFFGFFLHANEEILVIDSDLADYDGAKITLSGSVVVEHELGNISSGNMILTPANGTKKLRFSSLNMHDNVKILFRDGGHLSCASAYIDSKAQSAKFSGNADQEYVIYSESRLDQAGRSIPLVVKSRQMNVKIFHNEDENEHVHSTATISEIEANDKVTVNYNHDIIALSDNALYQRESKEIPGMILMKALDHSGLCQATNRNGDIIRSTRMQIDLVHKQLSFYCPKGSIYTPGENENPHRIDFACQMMTWHEPQDLLVMNEKIVINQEGFGQLSSNEEVKIQRHMIEGIKRLQFIESFGETILSYIQDGNPPYTLRSYGQLTIDHEKLQTRLESPHNGNGEVLNGKQIHFQDRLGEIYADKAIVSYDYINRSIVPAKLILQGHVQILNRTAADDKDRGRFLQYAIADEVEYFPLQSKMVFKAQNGGRVLFYDKANNFKVSAPALKIMRDPNSKKDSIKGVGDVRFSFIDEELEELRKRFNLPEEEGS